MNKYKLLDGTHTLDGVVYRKGGNDVMTLSDDQAKKLGGRVVLLHSTEGEQQSTRTVSSTETEKPSYTPMTVDELGTETGGTENGTDNTNNKATSTADNSTGDTITSTTPESSKDWSKTQDMKATDVIAMIKETDSKEELEALQEVEENGQNRIGVMKEIDKRLAQLEEDDE